MSEGLLDRQNWVTIEQARAIVRKSPQTIYRWLSSGRIRTMQPGVEVWIYLPDLWETEKQMRRLGMKHKKRRED